MKIKASEKKVKADLIVVPVFKKKKLSIKGVPTKIFKGDLGETAVLDHSKVFIGLGEEKELSVHKMKEAGSKLAPIAKSLKATSIAIENPKSDIGMWMAFALALKSYKFEKYISKKDKDKIKTITVVGKTVRYAKETETFVDSICYTRDLVNSTSNDIGPKAMVLEAKKLAKANKNMRVTVLDRKKLEKMGMGAIISVGQGSQDGPYIVAIEYKNKPKKGSKPIAIVGKGLTFDSGGINLKPTGHIETMKQDKAGACTVLGVMKQISKSKHKGHVVGVLGLAENLIGSKAIRPGDIIKSYSGKTIEITNTDAEGRMVLADTLAYTEKKFKPSHMIDMATLTGAAIVALGSDITALLSTDRKLAKTILDMANKYDEPTWELPLYEDYCKKTKGEISDLKNYTKTVRAGTIMGGAFLKEFVKETPLAHLDMGGTAWTDQGNSCSPQGATGANVVLITKVIEELMK